MSYYDKDNSDAAYRIGRFPGPGLNSVAEYQQAGRIWMKDITSSVPLQGDQDGAGTGLVNLFSDNLVINDDAAKIEFPFVTKKVTISNSDSGAGLYVYFCSLRVPATDLDDDITTRGNSVTDAELAEYWATDGDNDNSHHPDSAVKANGHWMRVAPASMAGTPNLLELNVKCRRIYVARDGVLNGDPGEHVLVHAELTNIVHPYNLDLRGIEGISGGDAGTVKS